MNAGMKVIGASLAATLLAGCASTSELTSAAAHYRHHHDFASLQSVSRLFEKGMPQRKVLRLLGEGYSPVDGQYYFSSDEEEYVPEAEREMTVTLVVEFRDEDSRQTGELQSWNLGPIGE